MSKKCELDSGSCGGRNLINIIGHKSPIAADKNKCEKKLSTSINAVLAWNLAQKKREEMIKYHKILYK